MRVYYQARCRRFLDSVVFVDVRPPLSERKMPPSSASTIAHTRSGFAGETATPILPTVPRGRPGARVSSVQVSPPSVDLKRPLPCPPLSNVHGLRMNCQNEA